MGEYKADDDVVYAENGEDNLDSGGGAIWVGSNNVNNDTLNSPVSQTPVILPLTTPTSNNDDDESPNENSVNFNEEKNNFISINSPIENPIAINNNLNISKSDLDLRDSLKESFDIIKNISIDQQKTPIHTVNINSPIVMDNGNVSIIYQDVYGNEYNKSYVYFKDNTYFGLTDKIYDYLGIENDIPQYKSEPYYSSLTNNFEIFNLKHEIKEISYFVYSFVDLFTNEITYNRYIGDIDYVGTIPMGKNIPKITEGDVIQRIDPESIVINTYTTSTKISEKKTDNEQIIYNVILTSVFIPKIQFILNEDNSVTCDFKDQLEAIKYKKIIKDEESGEIIEEYNYGLSTIYNETNNDYDLQIINDNYNGHNNLEKIYDTLSVLIDKYSLYSPINVITKTTNTLLLKPITLYIPKKIFTKPNGDYVPYTKEDLNSNLYLDIDSENNKIKIKIKDLHKSTDNKDGEDDENDGQIENIFKEENKIILSNIDWFEFYNENGISICINKTQISQDNNFNYIEELDNTIENINDNSIINFLIQDKNINEIYSTKIRLNDLPISKYLYTYTNIVINEPRLDYTNDYMSYMKFLETSTTAYKLQYIDCFSYKYYKQVGLNPQIEYVKDILYERNGLELQYSYWVPDLRSYVPYTNKVLEFNGNYYGSNIFKSNYFHNLINESQDLHDIELIELFERTRLNKEDNIGNDLDLNNVIYNLSYIKGNEEITYNTYLYKPFELKNETVLEFAYEYEFIPPKISYIINSVDINLQSFIENKDSNDENDKYTFTYNVTYSLAYIEYNDKIVLNSFNVNEFSEYKLNDDLTYIEIILNEENNLNFGETKSNTIDTNVFNKLSSSSTNTFSKFLQENYENSGIISYEGYGPKIELLYKFFTLKEKESEITIFESTPDWSGKNVTVITENYSYKFNVTPKIDIEIHNSEYFDRLIKENSNKNVKINLASASKNSKLIYDNSKVILNKEYNLQLTYTAVGHSYNYTPVIINDGYWKRNYNETNKPLLNITYSYASNSIDISNAYIVPNTKNERLGFIKQNKIAYNILDNTYIETYVYTYINRHNVQCLFDDKDPNNLIINSNDKFYGITKKENKIKQKLFNINSIGLLEIWNELNYNLINNDKVEFLDKFELEAARLETKEGNSEGSEGDNKKIIIEEINEENVEKINEKIIEELNNKDSKLLLSNENFEIYNNKYYKKINSENNDNKFLFGVKITNEKNITKKYYKGNIFDLTTDVNYINEMVELQRRLSVSVEKQLKEVIYQEEELISQNAQIDTPFGVVNGKKVIVTDEIYIPPTYVTITTIDPETYNYISYDVISEEAHFAYTYEIEDIPLITASYLYTNEDGIKIRGLDNLIEILSKKNESPVIIESTNDDLDKKSIVNTINNNQWLRKIHNTLLSYMSTIDDSLSYISNLSESLKLLSYTSSKTDDSNPIIKTLSLNNKELILADANNTTNIINAQKAMVNKLSESLSIQTTTLSKLLLSDNSNKSEIINDISLNEFYPQNWSTISLTGYEYTYTTFINSYKPVSHKSTKIINREQYRTSYITRTGTYSFEEPKGIYYSYSNFIDPNMSSIERIGLKLNKETKDFSYNGYVYRQDIYSYQNLADILSDLHVSTRIPTRKEFIVDVSKRLYINSDFIFAYTSPNEYAVRAIYRADVLWSELVKAGIVENTKMKLKDIPEEIINQK